MILKEVADLLNADIKTLLGEYKVTIIGFQFVCIQNYKKLLEFSNEKIVLRVKNNELNIEGINLNILELGVTEITISGSVNKIYLSKEAKNAENKL